MDENSKTVGDAAAPKTSTATTTTDGDVSSTAEVSSNRNPVVNANDIEEGAQPENGSESARTREESRTPFTNLSQVDADLALARTLQEQERAYMMLSMGGGVGYGRWDTGLYIHNDEGDDFGDFHDHEYDEEDEDEEDDDDDEEGNLENYNDEDAFDVHAHSDSGDNDAQRVELDPSAFPDDETYARALQDAEEQEMASRLLSMAGISEREIVDVEEHEDNSQDTWEDVDPDELSYEELIALGEVVGTESRGLSADTIASLPSTNYKSPNAPDAENDSCVICRLDYEDDDALTTLPCKHAYHSECINNWLNINKACPVCSAEVSTSGNS